MFVDAETGNDETGDGTETNPYQTIDRAENNPDLYDGMVLVGLFDIGSDTTFVDGWSYTGHGTETVIQVNGGTRNVASNNFYRLIFDFNHVHEGASFTGNGDSGFYNVVFRDQHTTHGGRELIYATDSDTFLTLENCLLYDVEFNVWVWNHGDNYEITNTVSANCDSRFTLAGEAPSVDVDESYLITSDEGNDRGVYASGSIYSFEPEPEPEPGKSNACPFVCSFLRSFVNTHFLPPSSIAGVLLCLPPTIHL